MKTNTRNGIIVLIVVAIIALLIIVTMHKPITTTTPPVITPPVTDGLSQTYNNATLGFSLRYPAGFTINDKYSYQELGPGKDIYGVKFTIPALTAMGTNLGSDSYISVEELPQAKTCNASSFLDQGAKITNVTDNGTEYSMGTSNGAGAGNRYDETVYALTGTNPCIAVRYFIHYSVIDNYPPGTVKAFDEATLKSQFDAIRRTLVIQ